MTLGGCASAPSRLATSDEPAPVEGSPPSVRFDNDSRDYVQVYLVGLRREWLLGRATPGARATLRIPEEALAEDAGQMRIAVVPGTHTFERAALDERASSALPRPIAEILGQRWTFSQKPTYGELTAFPLGGLRTGVGRP
jgi:hypothetical protein